MKLNEDAKAVLRDAGVSQAAWARANYMADGKWTGDPCGCPDSGRCMNGFHHFPDDECGCLRALLERYLAGEGTFAEYPAGRLTDYDRRTIAEARRLTGLGGPEAVRELAGDEDTGMAYAVAFGRAQHHLRDLLAIIDRPGGGPAPAFCRACRRATTSRPCGRCGGPESACAGCGRCPDCDGDLPGEEE